MTKVGVGEFFFGSLAIKNNLATQEEVEECLDIQNELSKNGVNKSLGKIMMENGLLSEKQVKLLLQAQKTTEMMLEDTLCGKIALKNGLVTKEQLVECLQEQRRNPKLGPIGQIMLDKGYLNDQQLEAILKTQQRLKDN